MLPAELDPSYDYRNACRRDGGLILSERLEKIGLKPDVIVGITGTAASLLDDEMSPPVFGPGFLRGATINRLLLAKTDDR